MATVPMDIVEIRRTVYGKAMREPIADACLHLKDKNHGVIVKRLDFVEARPLDPYYDDFYTDSGGTTNLVVANIEGEDYLLTDSRTGDSVDLIENEDYCYNLDDASWSTHMDVNSNIDYRIILNY